jgi:hypothetical protein
MARRTVIVLLAAAALASACGGGSSGGGPAPGASGDGVPADAKPALARAAKRPGEVLVDGQASPASHGPFTLRGRYVIRFEQIAPEDPKLDFATQTPFVAALDRKAEQDGPGSVRLFRTAARTGRKEMRLSGRFFIDVSFGDFPYAVRLTPADRR